MRDAAERDDRGKAWRCRDGAFEKWQAGLDLGRCRLVFRGHATHRIGDLAIDELETVIGIAGIGPAGETEREQRCIEKVAGEIAGEGPPGAIGALEAGRQPDDQKPAFG